MTWAAIRREARAKGLAKVVPPFPCSRCDRDGVEFYTSQNARRCAGCHNAAVEANPNRKANNARAMRKYSKRRDVRPLLNLRSRSRLRGGAAWVRFWIESQFAPGMSWSNYGDWEVDHIFPLRAFDPSCPKQSTAAGGWQNLRPAWRADNRRKGTDVPRHYRPDSDRLASAVEAIGGGGKESLSAKLSWS